MQKKIMRKIAALLAAILVFTSISPLTIKASAEESADTTYETVYNLSELSKTGGWGNEITADGDNQNIHYTAQYAEADFAIPEEVLKSGLVSVTVDASSSDYLAIKILDSARAQLSVDYGKKKVSVDRTLNIAGIGIMSTNDSEWDITVGTVTFTTVAPLGEEAKTLVTTQYALNEMQGMGGYNYTQKENNMFSIASQYQLVSFAIPEEVLAAKLVSVSVISSDFSKVSVKSLDASDAQLEINYRNPSLTIGKDTLESIKRIGVMSLDEGETEVNIDGFIFVTEDSVEKKTPEKTEEQPEQKPEQGSGDQPEQKPENQPAAENPLTETFVYEAKDLDIHFRWNASSKAENGHMEFPSNYYEFCADLPEAIDCADIVKIVVNVENQTGSLSVKTYNTTQTGDSALDNTTPCQYGLNGADSYSINVPSEGVLASLGFMSHIEADAPFEATLKSIEITVKTKAIELGTDELSNLVNRWNGSDVQGPSLKFTNQYQEYVYTLDSAIATDNIASVVVKVKDQGGNICVKFYDEAGSEWFHNYGVSGSTEYTFIPEEGKDIKKISFMSMLDPDVTGNYPYGITIESVTINLKAGTSASDSNEEVTEFTGDALKFVHRSDDAEEVGNTLSFSKKWDEYYLDLGKEFNLERCKSFVVKVKDQNGLVSYKFYDKDDKELQAFYQKSGNTSLSATGDVIRRLAVMAHDDDVEYPFTITIESVKIVMDTTPYEEVEKGVEYDIVSLRDPVTATVGEDFLIGTAISYQEFSDSMEMALVTKHFNALTLGNELKPDSILGSGNNNLQTVSLNGVTFEFPTLTYSTPERYLDYVLDWNAKNPDKQIKVRGHVLVWHSQTPTWFFREGYKSDGAYVSPDEMALRQEYYIKSVCEHFTADDSKYKDLFYGWDVVNEAVSDSTGTYRNAGEKSEWWAVYNSNRFITDAFVFANKYMNPNIELYYNDYNDTLTGKIAGIEQLLRDVVATPGARIDGMGMQSHYTLGQFSEASFYDAARKYASIVGSVQVTELDFKGATSATDERIAQDYLKVYNAIRHLREDGIDFSAMIIWGVVDKHSWLQTQNSAGGGSTTNTKQYPLLFDNNYKAKEAFYAIANAGELMPDIKTVTLVKSVDDKFTAGKEHTFRMGGKAVSFVPEWSDGAVSVKVTVPDTNKDAADKVVLYVNDGTETQKLEVLRNDAKETADGYEVTIKASVATETIKNNKVKLDVTVTDGEKTYAFNDTRLKQDASADYFAKTVVKAAEIVTKGTVTVDGEGNDAAWTDATEVILAINNGAEAEAKAKLLWDETNLYVLVTVKDAVLDDTASDNYQQDSLEVFIDENNGKTTSYEDDDKQYRINYKNVQSFNNCSNDNIVSAAKITDDGYVIEAAFKWTHVNAVSGLSIGFDAQINDGKDGSRKGTLNWADSTGNGWSSPSVFGTIVLKDNSKAEENTPSGNGGSTAPSGSSGSTADTSNNTAATTATTTTAGNNTPAAGGVAPSVNEVPGRVDNTGETQAVTENVSEPVSESSEDKQEAAVEETKDDNAAAPEPSQPSATTEIAEEETPQAAAPEATKSMGFILILAIGAAVISLGGIGASLYIFKVKK